METAYSRIRTVKPPPKESLAGLPSPALEWLWKYVGDVRQPKILDCGPLKWSTIRILLARNAKLYVGDVISPLLNTSAKFWDRSGKTPVFKFEQLIAEFPQVPPATLTCAFCWHLLDLLPIAAVPPLIERVMNWIAPGGALFFMLREPYLHAGADSQWGMETLKVIISTRKGERPFPNPVVTSREIEKVVPAGSLKVFLTRSGRREIIALK